MYKIFVNPFRIQEVTSLRSRNIQTSVQADSKDENLNYFAKKISRIREGKRKSIIRIRILFILKFGKRIHL